VEIVAELWHPQVVYPSTILKLHELCVDRDETHIGPRLLGVATKWILLYPIRGD